MDMNARLLPYRRSSIDSENWHSRKIWVIKGARFQHCMVNVINSDTECRRRGHHLAEWNRVGLLGEFQRLGVISWLTLEADHIQFPKRNISRYLIQPWYNKCSTTSTSLCFAFKLSFRTWSFVLHQQRWWLVVLAMTCHHQDSRSLEHDLVQRKRISPFHDSLVGRLCSRR